MKSPLQAHDPETLGAYRLLGRLGAGGMGTVFLGETAEGRRVAVKVIRPEYAGVDEFRSRFRREVTQAAQVPPFCTAAVLDADPDHATPYLVVEFIDGPSLREMIERDGPLTGGSLQSVAIGVATALTAIHSAGVIHRDLKPENVLMAPGLPKVIDFGIARALDVTSALTGTDHMVGTVAYMAPERFENDSSLVTPAADIFAWGAVIAYAAQGRTPFDGGSAASTAGRILTQPPRLDGLDGRMRDLVELALAKDPQERPTATELLDLLLADEHGPATELRRTAKAAQRRKPRRRGLIVAGLAALLLVGGAGAAVVAGGVARTEETSTAAATVVPEPEPEAAPVSRVVGPSVTDPLDRPGQWRTTANGSCRFVGGRYEVRLRDDAEVSDADCPGPEAIFGGDQSAAVDVTLGDADSCARLSFRVSGDSGYQALLCRTRADVELDNRGDVSVLATAPVALTPGTAYRAVVTIREQTGTLAVDGTDVVTFPAAEPSLSAGRVSLGVVADGESVTAAVRFAHADLRSLSSVRSVYTFTDPTTGSVTTSAKLHAFDRSARSAVLEPIIFMGGPDFCAKYRIPATDGRCEEEWTTEDSNRTVTMPLAAEVDLRTVNGNPDCIEKGCPAGAARFAEIVKEQGMLATVTARDGVVTAISEQYTP